jgi:hypothetical protein
VLFEEPPMLLGVRLRLVHCPPPFPPDLETCVNTLHLSAKLAELPLNSRPSRM